MRLTYSSELASSDKRNHYATSRFESAGKPVTKVNINITSIVKYLLSQSYHIIPLLKHTRKHKPQYNLWPLRLGEEKKDNYLAKYLYS